MTAATRTIGWCRLDEAAARELHRTAVAEIVAADPRLESFGSSAAARMSLPKLKAGSTGPKRDATAALAAEAECTLLELVDAGLPEWVERGRAEHFTPIRSRGRWRSCRRLHRSAGMRTAASWIPAGRGSRTGSGGRSRPGKFEVLHQVIASCQSSLRVFLSLKAIIELFSQELGLDLCLPPVRDGGGSAQGHAHRLQSAGEMCREGEPDEDGFVPADRMLHLPGDFSHR